MNSSPNFRSISISISSSIQVRYRSLAQKYLNLASSRWSRRALLSGSSRVHALAPVHLSVSFLMSIKMGDLHEGPAEKGNSDHRQPGRHLREAPSSVSVGNGQTVLLQRAIEGVEKTLVRSNLVNLVINKKFLESLGGGRGAVQRLVADLGNRRRLVSQRLGNAELDQRWRADRPRVAENVLPLTVDEAKFGRRRLGGDDRGGCLELLATRLAAGPV